MMHLSSPTERSHCMLMTREASFRSQILTAPTDILIIASRDPKQDHQAKLFTNSSTTRSLRECLLIMIFGCAAFRAVHYVTIGN